MDRVFEQEKALALHELDKLILTAKALRNELKKCDDSGSIPYPSFLESLHYKVQEVDDELDSFLEQLD